MITNNIFLRKYDVAENKLTEAFIRFLSVLDTKILEKILLSFDIRGVGGSKILFDMQERCKDSVPDGVITDGKRFLIYIEVKRVYATVEFTQLKNHAQSLINSPYLKRILWIIAPDIAEPKDISKQWASMKGYKKISRRYTSWSEVWRVLSKVLVGTSETKDSFLIKQFLDYLREEGVVIMDQAIKKNDGKDWVRICDWIDRIENFLRKEIKEYIILIQKDFVYQRPSSDGRQIFIHFFTDKREVLHFYAGFEVGIKNDPNWQEPCFYVGWALRSKKAKALMNDQRFIDKEKQLIKNGFLHCKEENRKSFYRKLKISDLVKIQNVEKQINYIKLFIDGSIREFNKINLRKII
jgi:hypothetical protein